MISLIDPWASSSVDYDKLINKFGISKISDLLLDIKNPQRLMKRGVVFGHRDFDKINELINQKKDFAVVSGMMPSGQMHIGHKMVVDQLKWYQEKGAMLSLPIADLESESYAYFCRRRHTARCYHTDNIAFAVCEFIALARDSFLFHL